MTAVLGGLGAALAWSAGTVFASRAARAMGPILTLAWVMLVGLVAVVLLLPVSGSAHISAASALWLALGGAGNVAGLLLIYQAVRIGQMGVVMPIASAEGGIAALAAIVAGQAVGVVRGIALAVTVVGVIMTALARRPADAESAGDATGLTGPVPAPSGHRDRLAAAWAVGGAVSFGISLFATGKASGALPATWAVMPPRIVGVLTLTIPLLARRELRLAKDTGHLVFIAGLCEVAGFFSYAVGARHGIAVAAVLATLTGAFGAGFGAIFFGERLRPTQVAGVFTIFVGVAALSAISA